MLLIHVAYLCFFYYFDEAAYTRCSKPWPYFEVACVDGFTPSGRAGILHCCIVELNELARGFAFINVVEKPLVMGMAPNFGIMAPSL